MGPTPMNTQDQAEGGSSASPHAPVNTPHASPSLSPMNFPLSSGVARPLPPSSSHFTSRESSANAPGANDFTDLQAAISSTRSPAPPPRLSLPNGFASRETSLAPTNYSGDAEATLIPAVPAQGAPADAGSCPPPPRHVLVLCCAQRVGHIPSPARICASVPRGRAPPSASHPGGGRGAWWCCRHHSLPPPVERRCRGQVWAAPHVLAGRSGRRLPDSGGLAPSEAWFSSTD